MQQVAEQDAELSEVNVIPLADLSLVLLIILMVLSPMVMQSLINVQASKAAAVRAMSSRAPDPPLIVSIEPGAVRINTIKASSDIDLARRLAQALERRHDKTVLMTADAKVPHGRVVQVLDLAKRHGAGRISLLQKAAKQDVLNRG